MLYLWRRLRGYVIPLGGATAHHYILGSFLCWVPFLPHLRFKPGSFNRLDLSLKHHFTAATVRDVHANKYYVYRYKVFLLYHVTEKCMALCFLVRLPPTQLTRKHIFTMHEVRMWWCDFYICKHVVCIRLCVSVCTWERYRQSVREGGRLTDTHRASRAWTDDDTFRDGANTEGRGRWG